MDLITTQDNAAANLPQLEARLKVRLESWTNQTIEIGRDLIAAKKLVPHGGWQKWLKDNFSLSDRTARRFMGVAERFGKTDINVHFEPTQMIQLLALPDAEETEKFIAEKAAEGKRVDEMTIKQLREEIADYKKQLQDKDETIAQRDATIEKQAESHQQSLFDFNAQLDERDERIGDLEKELADRPTVAPDDYDETKEALVDAKIALREAEVKAESALREEQLKSEAALREEKSKSNTALRDAKRDAYIELREAQRKAQLEFDELKKQSDELQGKLDKAKKEIIKLKKADERRERKAYEPPTELPTDKFKLIRADIRNGLAEIEDNSVDFIITDPPYPKEFLPLYADLSKIAARVLKDGGSLICMTGQSYLPEVIQLLSAEMRYHWCLCYLTPGQKTQLWARHLHTSWKPLLWFIKGEYRGDWLGDDVTVSPAKDKNFHEWGQSLSGMKDIVERFTNPNDVILDPFLGGGTTGVVAVMCGRKFIGVDVEQNCIDTSLKRIHEAFKDE